MQEQRKRILQLVENGTITADEAIVLLEKLSAKNESTPPTVQPVVPSTEKEDEPFKAEPFEEAKKDESKKTGFEDIFGKSFNDKEFNQKVEDFMGDIKKDLSQFSTRMTGIVGAALTKLKDLDIETPFGEKVDFAKTYAYPATEVRSIELDIANGKIDVVKAMDELVTVQVTGKAQLKGTEEETIAQITEELVTKTEDKIHMKSENKFTQIKVKIAIPEKHYDVFIARLLTGAISVENLDAKLIKARTYNGTIRLEESTFDHAELQTSNGAVEARKIKGDDLEIETANGRIYVDGELKEVEAESMNGTVAITTTSKEAHKLKARALAGSVEIYVPKTVALEGQIYSNFGKADVGLSDAKLYEEEEQFLLKSVRFTKELEGAKLLKITGESRTGTVLVRYTLQ
ncbi:MAG: DUF4097 family beta strand repeat-containing protein [Solibacillus sp.]